MSGQRLVFAIKAVDKPNRDDINNHFSAKTRNSFGLSVVSLQVKRVFSDMIYLQTK